jgi:hypothetical protein
VALIYAFAPGASGGNHGAGGGAAVFAVIRLGATQSINFTVGTLGAAVLGGGPVGNDATDTTVNIPHLGRTLTAGGGKAGAASVGGLGGVASGGDYGFNRNGGSGGTGAASGGPGDHAARAARRCSARAAAVVAPASQTSAPGSRAAPVPPDRERATRA